MSRDRASVIHPTAVIEAGAQIEPGVEVGAYTVVGPEAALGEGAVIGHHVVLEGTVRVGRRVRIGHGSVVGSPPQDLKFREGTPSGVMIGDDTVVREHVTIHRATAENGWTRIGSGSLIMASSHIAHDCKIGDHAIIINYAGITGHVEVQDYAVVGGLTGIAPFVRIGVYAYIGGCSKVVQDVPPYVMVDGAPATARCVNAVGLRRAGVGPETRKAIQHAFRILYRSGLSPRRAMEHIRDEVPSSPFVNRLIEFIEGSKRGICGGSREPARLGAEEASIAEDPRTF